MSEHIVQPRIYIGIFLSLMVGTALTVLAAFYDFPGPLNAVVALTIAVIKATLVVLFFMHLWEYGGANRIIMVVSLLYVLYYLRSERSWDFVFGILYGYFSFFALTWIFPYAALTIRARGWLTR